MGATTTATRTAAAVTTLADRKRADTITGYIFMTPAMVVFLVFLIIPIGFALYISFTNWNGITPLAQQATPATGTITFTNLTTDEIVIPAGTIVASGGEEAVEFRTTENVTLPAGQNSTIDVPVEAVDGTIGPDGNLRRGQIETVVGDLSESVSVTNAEALSGGQDNAYEFVGLQNYSRLLLEEGTRQRDFFISFKNSVYFMLGVVPMQTILALVLAVIVNQRWLKAKGFFRTSFYFPSITSSVVISLIFMWMFTRGGLVNFLLSGLFPNYEAVTWLEDPNGIIHNMLGLFGITRQTAGDWASTRLVGLTLWEWVSGPSVTMATIMVLNTWTTIGTLMIIYLAALQNIPSSVYEAAAIDGATAWQTFRRITVPLLTPTTFFVVTLGLIGTLQVFDQIFVISSGGPAKTTLTIAYIVYQNGFNNSQMGLAAATALVLFGIIFVFTMIQRRITSDTVQL